MGNRFTLYDPQVNHPLGEKIVSQITGLPETGATIYQANGSTRRIVSARSGPTETRQNGTPAISEMV